MNYKEFRIYLSSPAGAFIVAASDTVNNLVELTKMWLTQTSAGMYMLPEANGTVILQRLDRKTGAYRSEKSAIFSKKKQIIKQVRAVGGR